MNFSMDQFEELNNKRTELIDHMEFLKVIRQQRNCDL